MASSKALLVHLRTTRRRLEAKTEPRDGIDYSDLREVIQRAMPKVERETGWKREGEPWAWRDEQHDAHVKALELPMSEQATADLEDADVRAEVDALAGDHDDIDALRENLPAIPVPPETAPIRVRLWWAVRRWWHGWRERLRH